MTELSWTIPCAPPIEQLVNGFVPYSLGHMFEYNLDFRNVTTPEDEVSFVPPATALVPMIVTNASLYRLKPDVTKLDAIREAKAPSDVADEVEWTWHYYDVPLKLFRQNFSFIDAHAKDEGELVYHFPNVSKVMEEFAERPNWIAIVNIKVLPKVVIAIQNHFSGIEARDVENMTRQRRGRRRKR